MPLAVQIIIAILSASTLLWIVTTTIVCYNVTFSMRERTEAALSLPSLPKGCTNGEALFSTFYAWQMRPYERVEIIARDGTRLSARYYHINDNAPLAICFHGYKSNPLRDCYGLAEILSSEGFNLLLDSCRVGRLAPDVISVDVRVCGTASQDFFRKCHSYLDLFHIFPFLFLFFFAFHCNAAASLFTSQLCRCIAN